MTKTKHTVRSTIGFAAAIVLCAAMLVSGAVQTALAEDGPQYEDSKWMRLAGDTRYDTMAAVVQEAFPEEGYSDFAVVATGENFPDALAASALAGSAYCPIILTEPNRLSEQAKNELKRLGVHNVYIIGGTGAVSAAVEEEISSLNDGDIEVVRVAGKTRRETAVEAMKLVSGESDTVIVATGEDFADALSIAPWSYFTRSPIVLTKADGTLDAATIQAIMDCEYSRFIIVGGTGVVAQSVEDELIEAGLVERERMAGRDRYETSWLVARFCLTNGMCMAYPAVATGENYPDALASAPLQGSEGACSVTLLVKDFWSDGVLLLADHGEEIEIGYVIGGEGAVSQDLMNYIRDVTEF